MLILILNLISLYINNMAEYEIIKNSSTVHTPFIL